jgi:1,4-dihydroxy-2-naphthoate octaprenyltransferase
MLCPVRRALWTVWAFLKLGRPVFLLGGFVLYGLGAAWARHARGALDGATYLWGQATITAAQLMTHYANDYFDLEADRANVTPTRWSGGSRVLVQSALPPAVALAAAVVLGLIALALGLVAAARAPEPATNVAELLAIVVLAWAYSAPPARLVGRGAGELATALVVTVLTPLWSFHLQRPDADGPFLLTLVVLALLQIAMLFAINFPDAAGDRASGKRTLVVLLGTTRAIAACRLLLLVWGLALPVLGVAFRRAGAPWWIALGPGICAPLAVWQALSLGALGRSSSLSPSSPSFPSRSRVAYAGIAFRGVAMLFLASSGTLCAIVVADWAAQR